MEITQTLDVQTRSEWRAWLQKHHATAKDVWLVYNLKSSGKPRLPYEDSLQEALCFGWIDSIVKKLDSQRNAQRYSPRKPGSNWSEPNKHRVRQLMAKHLMHASGIAAATFLKEEHLQHLSAPPKVPAFIRKALQAAPPAWKNFKAFSPHYQRVRVSWVADVNGRPQEQQKRLRYFVKMTQKNRKYGFIR